jgi:hypothetical protein
MIGGATTALRRGIDSQPGGRQRGQTPLFYSELAEAFPNAKAVNEALRGLLDVAATTARLTRRSTGRAKQQRAG